MRPIDADGLAREICRDQCEKDGCGSHCELIAYVENAPTIGGWISVKDRMPEKSGTYLCYQPKAADICALNTVRWSTQHGWMGKEVGSRIEGIEYWMPLPEPPKEEEHADGA